MSQSLNDTIPFKIKYLKNEIGRYLGENTPTLDGETFTGMQIGIIEFLNRRQDEPSYQRDLEAGFNIRRPTATGILNIMEQKGLIRRAAVSHDARLKEIILTDKGKTVSQLAEANFRRLNERLLKDISDEELQTFDALFNKFLHNLNADHDQPEDK